MKYILAKRVKGNWYGVAGWNPKDNQTCLATAETVFRANGYKWNSWENTFKCYWGSIEDQKNYKGRLYEFKEVTK
jgi:hypothetical protein